MPRTAGKLQEQTDTGRTRGTRNGTQAEAPQAQVSRARGQEVMGSKVKVLIDADVIMWLDRMLKKSIGKGERKHNHPRRAGAFQGGDVSQPKVWACSACGFDRNWIKLEDSTFCEMVWRILRKGLRAQEVGHRFQDSPSSKIR